MSTNDNRAARAWTDAASADATADVEAARAHANTGAQVHEDAQAQVHQVHEDAPQPDPTHAHADIHERASQTLDFSDLRDDPPEDHSNPMTAIRDAVADLKDVQQRERAADESKSLPAETARRWHRAHKDSDSQTPPRRKRGSSGWRR